MASGEAILLKYGFSPFTNEFEVMAKLQSDYDAKLESMGQLNLRNMASLLDELESDMNEIDSQREKPIFI